MASANTVRVPPESGEGRNTAARFPVASCNSACSQKRAHSSTQPELSTTPGRRNISHGARACVTATRSLCAKGACWTKHSQPATSATSAVASFEPPSAMITSRTLPAAAPDTNDARVGTSGRSLFNVPMMTLNIAGPSRSTGKSVCAAA